MVVATSFNDSLTPHHGQWSSVTVTIRRGTSHEQRHGFKFSTVTVLFVRISRCKAEENGAQNCVSAYA